MSISTSLGEQREVSLPSGTMRYRERGSGEPVLFVHGALVTGDLWRNVVPPLSERYRCLTPDWPLGSHQPALAPDSLTYVPEDQPERLAELIDRFLQTVAKKREATA